MGKQAQGIQRKQQAHCGFAPVYPETFRFLESRTAGLYFGAPPGAGATYQGRADLPRPDISGLGLYTELKKCRCTVPLSESRH
jgi:hypothetical protein